MNPARSGRQKTIKAKAPNKRDWCKHSSIQIRPLKAVPSQWGSPSAVIGAKPR